MPVITSKKVSDLPILNSDKPLVISYKYECDFEVEEGDGDFESFHKAGSIKLKKPLKANDPKAYKNAVRLVKSQLGKTHVKIKKISITRV